MPRPAGPWAHRAVILWTVLLLGANQSSPVVSVDAVGQDWRALSLESFDVAWKTIADTFPDPAFGGLDWNAVRSELRPKVIEAPTPDRARDVLREMLRRLGRSHFALLSSEREAGDVSGDARVPVDLRIIAGGAVVVALQDEGAAMDLHPGDRLLTIDGREVGTAILEAEGSDDRDRVANAWRRVTRMLYGAEQSIARVDLNRAGRNLSMGVARRIEPGDVVTLGNLPPLTVRTTASDAVTPAGRRVGVIAFNLWMPAVNQPFAEAIDRFRSADGLVIDLRGNLGGLADMMRGIAGHVLETPALLGRMHMRQADLEFRANPRRSTDDGRRVDPFRGRVAILVDELTGSTSECFAGGLQSLQRARVFGVRTLGQALPASTRRLPDGDVLMYAIGDFVTSTGQRLEGSGVTPDEIVSLSLQALRAGRDPSREAAFRWIDSP